jgi:hypothetical protein
VLSDGTICCLYEAGKKGPYETITFALFPLKWLGDGLWKQERSTGSGRADQSLADATQADHGQNPSERRATPEHRRKSQHPRLPQHIGAGPNDGKNGRRKQPGQGASQRLVMDKNIGILPTTWAGDPGLLSGLRLSGLAVNRETITSCPAHV